MKTVIATTGDFVREVEIVPILALGQTYHVQFLSKLLTAQNPEEPHRNLELILKREGLVALKALIDRTLAKPEWRA